MLVVMLRVSLKSTRLPRTLFARLAARPSCALSASRPSRSMPLTSTAKPFRTASPASLRLPRSKRILFHIHSGSFKAYTPISEGDPSDGTSTISFLMSDPPPP